MITDNFWKERIDMKAYFLSRAVAFLIDFFLIFLAVLVLGMFFPVSDRYDELKSEYDELSDKIIKGDISINETNQLSDEVNRLMYEMEKESYILTIIQFVINIVYYVGYQVYTKGQTIGKRLMRIAIKKEDGSDIDNIASIKRGIVLHGILVSLILLILLPIVTEEQYMAISMPLQLLSIILLATSVLMAAMRSDRRGLHDLFAGTKVVIVDDKVKETVVVKEMVTTAGEIEKTIVIEDAEEEDVQVKEKKAKETKPRKPRQKKSNKARE